MVKGESQEERKLGRKIPFKKRPMVKESPRAEKEKKWEKYTAGGGQDSEGTALGDQEEDWSRENMEKLGK